MFQKSEKPRTMLATRALVDEFANMETLPRDRPLSERRMAVYERILKAGEFRPVTWASAYCEETGSTYRVNGKHTSMLLSKLPSMPTDFYVTVERYICPTMEDVAKLYATFDSREAMRTGNEIIHSFASTVREFDGLNRRTLPLVVSAAAYHEWGMNYFSRPISDRAERLLDNIDFTIWLDAMLFPHEGIRSKFLVRTPVTTAMYGTWRKTKSGSNEFWGHVRDEDELQGSTTRVLARYLVGRTVKNAHTGTVAEKQVVSFREMYVKCIHSWNAWRKGETTNLKYFASAKIPAIV